MPDPRGQIVEKLGGTERILRLTLGGLLELEQRIGRSAMTLLDLERIGLRESVVVIQLALKGGGAEKTTFEATHRMLEGMKGGAIIAIAFRLVHAALREEDDDKEKKDEPAASP